MPLRRVSLRRAQCRRSVVVGNEGSGPRVSGNGNAKILEEGYRKFNCVICISRCPYRISLLGGGSDLGWFVDQEGYGISLGYSLSKYSYTVVNKLPKNSSRGILNYSSREEYFDPDEIAHPLIRSALKYFSVSDPIEMSSFGFASRGSGLGGSSSFLISLLCSLAATKDKYLDSSELAQIASNIELIG